ncbi:MAG: tetracycline resistance MFS efflux pump [Flammeovirgaceae bacterium]|nr:tetracycline resistance MFS efflux pump [Flammeovirgaceae bacterium]MBE61178.1 tetracycline resistance MFS efflux pump [Flammeovirgaceae bacterium]MBR07033.1 tetracycline resistance MFS efflux pump [Rickettsiales bacterium]HCX25203.1 tetracycline resistance MFS efflux pump [Cytophagales bacterium]|tara:strand:+ start:6472 stop:7683 length:1212 start_codon:yes stop_codon:yes gene_type:complete
MKNRKAAIGFILVTVLVDVIGVGIIIPVVPALITELTGGSISDASIWGGWLMFAYALMQFVCAPIVGALSDQYGRRPVLLLSLLGFGLDYILAGFAPTLGWLFLARIVAGITGASFTTANAYIADISAPEKRSQNFGMVGAAFGLGFIVGPLIGGVLGEYGSRVPFFASAGLVLLNWLYGYFVLPESLSKENRRPFSWRRANPWGTLMQLKKYPMVIGLLVSLVLVYIAAHATQSTWTYFTIEKFDWSEAEVGYSLAFVGFMIALVQGVAVRPIINKIGQARGVYVGLAFNCLGFILIAMSGTGWMLYLVLIPYAFGGIAGPSLQGLMSNSVPANEQGELQGGLTSLMSLTTVVGPPLMTNIFGYFTDASREVYIPSAPFYLAAVFSFTAMLMSYRFLKGRSA